MFIDMCYFLNFNIYAFCSYVICMSVTFVYCFERPFQSLLTIYFCHGVMYHELWAFSIYVYLLFTYLFVPSYVCYLCKYLLMKSQTDKDPEHAQYLSSLDVEHTVPSSVLRFHESSSTVGLVSDDDTCMCAGGVALFECGASSCKRKRTDFEEVCEMGLQKKTRCHMDLEVMPSGLLYIVCIPVVDHPMYGAFTSIVM